MSIENTLTIEKSRMLEMMGRIFRIREATLINGTVLIVDEARPDGVRTLKLENVEAALSIHPERGQAGVHFSAAHSGAQGMSAVSLSGTFRKAEQQTLSLEDAKRPTFPIQFDGQVGQLGFGTFKFPLGIERFLLHLRIA